jgi:CRP-like cAMP-binding protein
MDLEALEQAIASVSLFEHLRVDEVARVARRFALRELAPGEVAEFGGEVGRPDDAPLVIVVRGGARLEAVVAGRRVRSTLVPGDRFGATALVSGRARPFRVVARGAATLAVLDRAGLDALLAEFPAVALPLAAEISSELRARNDAVRQLLELHAERFPHDELLHALAERRRALGRSRQVVRRLSPRALFRWLVVQRQGEPPFWMLAGFIVSLGLARLVVYLILKYHLESQLFALVQGGTDPHPMHVHHFNYGLLLIGAAGLLGLFPTGRKALRPLAFVFGFGAGLVFDEFSLIWNLDPEYARPSSLIACGFAAALLALLTYCGRYWNAVLRRGWLSLRGWW